MDLKKEDEISDNLEEQGLIETKGKRIRITPKGKKEVNKFLKKNPEMGFLMLLQITHHFMDKPKIIEELRK